MMDVETVDILLAAYGKVIESMEEDFQKKRLLPQFRALIERGKHKFQLDGKLDINAFFFKFTVESENRAGMRQALWNHINDLQGKLPQARAEAREKTGKEVVIIIGNLDKLKDGMARKVFIEDSRLLTFCPVGPGR
uniref:Uncharacterized protein n=1 Tax=Candidatus Kentrum sp. TC TaxID=2126339 RepID=A0A450Z8U7_9GAMM|nr:MAG: hypothetical protein BECKTC1821D_GA0114238_109312 [Candidatus Kentron sp. TC]